MFGWVIVSEWDELQLTSVNAMERFHVLTDNSKVIWAQR